MLKRLAAVAALILLTACDPDAATTDLQLVNALRAEHGAQQLTRVRALDAKAVAQADIMAAAGEISHSTEAALKWGVPRGWRRIGENVAEARTLEGAQTVLEESPHHLANMLDPSYNQVGIGVTITGGRVYMVQVFVAR